MNKLKREKGKEKKKREKSRAVLADAREKEKKNNGAKCDGRSPLFKRNKTTRCATVIFICTRPEYACAKIALIIACPLDSNCLNIFFIIKLVSLSLSIFLASNTTAIVKSGALRMRNYSFEPLKARKK